MVIRFVPADIGLAISLYLEQTDIFRSHLAGNLLGDAAFKRLFERKYAKSLFVLKQPRPFSSFRAQFLEREVAQRRELRVVAGAYRYRGTSVDRKGVVTTRGALVFDASSFCTGAVVHTRDGGPALRGNGLGNLCSDFLALRNKRRWCLTWKERVERSVGAYTYDGTLTHEADGTLSWKGSFSWIGRPRGSFSYVLQRAAVDDDDDVRVLLRPA